MFGNFSQGQGLNTRQLLPAVEDLVIVYECPANVAAYGGSPPEYFQVSTLINSAPNFSNTNNSNANNATTARLYTGGGWDPLYGNGPYVEIANGSTNYFTSDNLISSINGGISIFALVEVDVAGLNTPSIKLTPSDTGDAVTIYFSQYDSGGGVMKHRIGGEVGADGIIYDPDVLANTNTGPRFLGYTTDFINSELFVSNSGATGFTSRATSGGGSNSPATDYFIGLNTIGSFDNARFSVQALYVWRKELSTDEITQLTTYLNDYFIPSV